MYPILDPTPDFFRKSLREIDLTVSFIDLRILTQFANKSTENGWVLGSTSLYDTSVYKIGQTH